MENGKRHLAGLNQFEGDGGKQKARNGCVTDANDQIEGELSFHVCGDIDDGEDKVQCESHDQTHHSTPCLGANSLASGPQGPSGARWSEQRGRCLGGMPQVSTKSKSVEGPTMTKVLALRTYAQSLHLGVMA